MVHIKKKKKDVTRALESEDRGSALGQGHRHTWVLQDWQPIGFGGLAKKNKKSQRWLRLWTRVTKRIMEPWIQFKKVLVWLGTEGNWGGDM